MTYTWLTRPAALMLAATLSLAACKNQGKVEQQDTSHNGNGVPGTGAGQSETGASGGSATSPGSGDAGAVPGTTSSGSGKAATPGSAPTSAR